MKKLIKEIEEMHGSGIFDKVFPEVFDGVMKIVGYIKTVPDIQVDSVPHQYVKCVHSTMKAVVDANPEYSSDWYDVNGKEIADSYGNIAKNDGYIDHLYMPSVDEWFLAADVYVWLLLRNGGVVIPELACVLGQH